MSVREDIAGARPATTARVLHVVDGRGTGTDAAVPPLVRATHPAVAHEVLALHAEDRTLLGALRALGVDVHLVPRSGGPGVRGVRALRSLLVDQHLDVVHVHAPLALPAVRLAVRSIPERRRPAIVHTDHEPSGRHHHLLARHELHLAAADLGIDVAAARAERSARTGVRASLGIDAAAPVVGIATSHPEARGGLWLDVTHQLCDASRDVHVVVFGDAHGGTGTRAGLVAARHHDRVHVLGPGTPTARAASAVDVMVLDPARDELPVALLEAQALGLPVVAPASGAITAEVHHGVDGLLVSPGDRVAFVSLVEALLADAARRARLGDAAAQRAERHDTVRAALALGDRYGALAADRDALSARGRAPAGVA